MTRDLGGHSMHTHNIMLEEGDAWRTMEQRRGAFLVRGKVGSIDPKLVESVSGALALRLSSLVSNLALCYLNIVLTSSGRL